MDQIRNHKPKPTASPRGGVGRKVEAKSRPEGHERHRSRGGLDETAKHVEVRVIKGPQRRCGGCARKVAVLIRGDLSECRPRRKVARPRPPGAAGHPAGVSRGRRRRSAPSQRQYLLTPTVAQRLPNQTQRCYLCGCRPKSDGAPSGELLSLKLKDLIVLDEVSGVKQDYVKIVLDEGKLFLKIELGEECSIGEFVNIEAKSAGEGLWLKDAAGNASFLEEKVDHSFQEALNGLIALGSSVCNRYHDSTEPRRLTSRLEMGRNSGVIQD